MFPHINLPELLVIGMLAIIFFGKDKLPSAAKSLGESIKLFKDSLTMEPILADTKAEVKAEKIALATSEIDRPKSIKTHKTKKALK